MKTRAKYIQQILFIIVWILSGLFAQASIKIMTYNLMGMKPDTDWQTRLHYTIQHLKTIDPDIIGLQEINEPQGGGGGINMANVIADSLGAHYDQYYFVYQEVTHTSWSQFDESIGIISKHPIISYGYDNLTPGVFPRKVVWTYIQTPIGYVHFFNTHLSYQNDHNSIRIQQTNEIKDFISLKESTWTGISSVLVGDFNCTPFSDPIYSLTIPNIGIGFTSTYAYINPNFSGYTYPADNPYKKIDYNFIKNSSYVTIDTSFIVIYAPYDGQHFPSDHYGVLTVLSGSSTPLNINDNDIFTARDFSLNQAYPNPFNATISIPFNVNGEDNIMNLSIYDISGKNIRTLLNRKTMRGKHTINWDGLDDKNRPLASGFYFISLRTLKGQLTQKIILLK